MITNINMACYRWVTNGKWPSYLTTGISINKPSIDVISSWY